MPEPFKYTKELIKLFTASENILLISHINPDGDAIGSQLALWHYLKEKGKQVTMMTPNYLQEFLKWMQGSDQINIFIRNRSKCMTIINSADLIVMLDFNHSNRLGEAENAVVSSNAKKVIIDHHTDPSDFADLLISDTSVCSTAEIVYRIVTYMNVSPYRNSKFAEAVYVGIITDTGKFDHGTYSGDTFRIVADLLDTGIDRSLINDLIYNNFTAERMKLMGYALHEKMVILPEYKTAYIALSVDELKSFRHTKGDTEGFVNLPLSINGIVFSVLFIEKEGFVKLSLRSKGNFPSNEFASRFFNGGGHVNASGGEFYDSLENTISYFLKILGENYAAMNNSV
ncbi:MAG TPA: bifunctional oligoribonuclease/PAP phosphatase NrnA [Bacteroidales bacterium]|nr:bifunctional oligoribonuclease/PAP phosphatase NrnA [Bacteroidales bacterium]HPF02274.1 bifunctional oligoribonuclease/PAP phosphatase NrnA [Bacteroidales bacterium]HPR12106.1 bifunctional oligoribonuclease/PAP phosphatase NrnA [Bacteroidales bacterium]HRW85306.1 bifunctional oligoribonuclease/PAP phosphatase NrnA [Bacteroidales bacterium]